MTSRGEGRRKVVEALHADNAKYLDAEGNYTNEFYERFPKLSF
jgi:hypothetical protein